VGLFLGMDGSDAGTLPHARPSQALVGRQSTGEGSPGHHTSPIGQLGRSTTPGSAGLSTPVLRPSISSHHRWSEGTRGRPQSADRRGRGYRHDAPRGAVDLRRVHRFLRVRARVDPRTNKGRMRGCPATQKAGWQAAHLTPEKLDVAHRLLAEGKGRAITARMIGVDPATLRRALNTRG
jgi:hypothetical protein